MNLMHAISNGLFGSAGAGMLTASHQAAQNQAALNSMLGTAQVKSSSSQTVFNGRINVEKVANGYVINIATREGYAFDTYIAYTIQEVNERIAASMVSFQLEGK
jgi:hypothetical protein